ncbi:hypothetical protein CAPTEDRAFT_198729 [Capitella teleta]|uniref:Reverse transcriptase domain-containing protein n=1 Tax=Capitella teleta TaxID=283909 RepID=R7V358_CAPTE|nr:hypothetical protein CAPTEDRAFT_198729 [Capitella teleta]|eukprot:ELU12927.1 hypothetical protein CAPTEDRAFT_198729 [Capitella teleta]
MESHKEVVLDPSRRTCISPPFSTLSGNQALGFTDDLNLLATNKKDLEDARTQILRFCQNARITMEPSKEHLTAFYPPRHSERTPQETTWLVGINLDQDLNMGDHIKKILNNARTARTQLIRPKLYCSTQQLRSM